MIGSTGGDFTAPVTGIAVCNCLHKFATVTVVFNKIPTKFAGITIPMVITCYNTTNGSFIANSCSSRHCYLLCYNFYIFNLAAGNGFTSDINANSNTHNKSNNYSRNKSDSGKHSKLLFALPTLLI